VGVKKEKITRHKEAQKAQIGSRLPSYVTKRNNLTSSFQKLAQK